MKMKQKSHSCDGYGSLVAMMVLVTMVTLVGVALNLTSTFARQAGRQRTVLHAQSAADSAVEYIFAKWKKDIKTNAYAPVNSSSFALPSTLHPALGTTPSTGTGVTPLFLPRPLTLPANVNYTTTDQWGLTAGTATTVKVLECARISRLEREFDLLQSRGFHDDTCSQRCHNPGGQARHATYLCPALSGGGVL